MDDRTTIAKDVLCALIASDGETEVDDRPCEYPQQYAVAAVEHADELLSQLTRTAKDKTPQCPPAQPAPKGPVWRKMMDVPTKPTHCIMHQYRSHFCVFWDMEKWVWEDNKDKAISDMRGAHWLDLNGFTPEVGE